MAKRMIPNVVRGGAAIPLKGKTNYYYMTGRKHKNGGIDIGENPRTGLEVEDGEVMHVSKNEVKVFSSVPFLNGESPAEKVMKGDNPNKVFNAQERYKDKNNINDDGTKKKARYGILDKIDEYTEKSEPYIAGASLGLTGTTLVAPNPYTAVGAYLTNLVGGSIDAYQSIRHFSKGNYKQGFQNAGEAALSLIGGKIIKSLAKTKAAKQIGAAREKMIDEAYRKRTNNKVKLIRKGLTDEQAASIILTNAANAVDNSTKFRDIKKGIEENNKKKVNTISVIGDAIADSNDVKEGINNKKMGGLSRSKDYGSKSKPYPKVKKKDFAGGNRSYPIPTKADAVDALRLAGLHGRSDVRAKVYNKYPELRKKSKAGGLYSVTVNGKTKLKMFPSTGERTKAAYGTEDSNKDNSNWFNKTTNKIKEYIDDNPDAVSDGIGLTSNILGSIISHKMNKDILNKMQYTPQPISRTATKLKTKININPQLDKMRETLSAYERNIDNNTASSRVALARKQRARLANMLQTNELYGNKENIETELINKDRLNQQAVADSNIKDYNAWRERKTAFDNAILEKKAENDVSLIENINTGVQDIIGKRQKRKSENQTITAMALANPNLPIKVFYEQGLINKKTYNAYKKAYKNNKKDKQD